MCLNGFPDGSVVKNLLANAGDRRLGFDPWVRKSPGGINGNPLQYSCLGNPMGTGAWWASQRDMTKAVEHTRNEIQRNK